MKKYELDPVLLDEPVDYTQDADEQINIKL